MSLHIRRSMASFLIITTLFSCFFTVQGLQLCPNLWTVYHGSCYQLYQGSEEFITANINSEHRHSAWIGANDMTTEGDWRWVAPDINVTYHDWTHGQPDNKRGGENCGLMDAEYSFKWNDEPCTNQHDFICETSCDEYVTLCGTVSDGLYSYEVMHVGMIGYAPWMFAGVLLCLPWSLDVYSCLTLLKNDNRYNIPNFPSVPTFCNNEPTGASD